MKASTYPAITGMVSLTVAVFAGAANHDEACGYFVLISLFFAGVTFICYAIEWNAVNIEVRYDQRTDEEDSQ